MLNYAYASVYHKKSMHLPIVTLHCHIQFSASLTWLIARDAMHRDWLLLVLTRHHFSQQACLVKPLATYTGPCMFTRLAFKTK